MKQRNLKFRFSYSAEPRSKAKAVRAKLAVGVETTAAFLPFLAYIQYCTVLYYS